MKYTKTHIAQITTVIGLITFNGTLHAQEYPGQSSQNYSQIYGHPNFNPYHPLFDFDGDGILNVTDVDLDGNGVCDSVQTSPRRFLTEVRQEYIDNEEFVPQWLWDMNEWYNDSGLGDFADPDNDGIPNINDPDDDGDNIPDAIDPDYYRYEIRSYGDHDGDGIENSIDNDKDDDGCPDNVDIDPCYPNAPGDLDQDGCPDQYDPYPCNPMLDGGCTGYDPTDPPDDPPSPPDDPGGPNPDGDGPDTPDPDYPDEPDEPDRPNDEPDPDEPTEPTDPDGGDPDLPEPDPTDACCAAITARLDTMILWADYNSGWNEANFNELKLVRDDMFQFMYDLMYGQVNGDGEPGMLQINNMQNADMIAQLEMNNLWNEYFNEYLSDQTWYLQKLYEQGLGEEPGTYEPPTTEEAFEPTSSDTAILQLDSTHRTGMSEHGQNFGLPQYETYQDETTAPVMSLPLASLGQTLGVPFNDLTVDFQPFTTVRDLVHVALIALVGLNAIYLVWGELRKT